MHKHFATAALVAAVAATTPAAHAISPDFDGEHGIEAHVTLGYSSLVNTSERLFQTATEARGIGTESNALSGGFNLHAGIGYRVFPMLSVGGFFEYQALGADPIVRTGGPTDPASASVMAGGVYGRLYFLWLATGTPTMRRVSFTSGGDARRFDPFVSLGVEYASIVRSTERPGTPLYARWTLGALGIPVTAGFDYRIIPAFALTLTAGVTPLFNVSAERSEVFERNGIRVTDTSAFESVVNTNASWFVGLGVRYTLSL